MSAKWIITGFLLSSVTWTACGSGGGSKSGGQAPAKAETGPENSGGDSSSNSSNSDTVSATIDPDIWLKGFYTGFNASEKFSIYLPSFREMTIDDPSIAKIEPQTITLSTETIEALIAERKEENPDFDDTRIRERLTRPRTVYKLTPLKAGQTKLRTKSGGGGGFGGGGEWNAGQAVVLVVSNYSSDLLAKGKARYAQEGEDTSRSCASCHASGDSKAPPHELGNIMSVPDVSAAQWISTGKVSGRVAKVPHAWTFASEEEKLGVVAYLRTLQTTDLETLTKLEFENEAPKGGGKKPGGSGKPDGAGTTPDPTTGP